MTIRPTGPLSSRDQTHIWVFFDSSPQLSPLGHTAPWSSGANIYADIQEKLWEPVSAACWNVTSAGRRAVSPSDQTPCSLGGLGQLGVPSLDYSLDLSLDCDTQWSLPGQLLRTSDFPSVGQG